MSSRSSDSVAPLPKERLRAVAAQSAWDVPTAACLLGLSVRQLERYCQRALGCTPTIWMQRERMATAAELLTAGEPIKTVAARLGYTLPANFSRDFKRHFGRTPRSLLPRPWLLPPAEPAAPDSDSLPHSESP